MTTEERLEQIERRQLQIIEAINDIENSLADLTPSHGTYFFCGGEIDKDGNWRRGEWR